MEVVDLMMEECSEQDEKEFFRQFGEDLETPDWKGFYNSLKKDALFEKEVDFTLDDIDQDLVILDEDFIAIQLKDGSYRVCCFHNGSYRIWEEDDPETLDWWNEVMNI